ncbi:MAG: hypothetical protein KAJ43_10905, partial [Gemmatimonadetes bacterium]|nr:hypothetical protein [Gemmatimonadota bacterium]
NRRAGGPEIWLQRPVDSGKKAPVEPGNTTRLSKPRFDTLETPNNQLSMITFSSVCSLESPTKTE